MVRRREEEKILDVNASMQGSLIFSDPVNLRISGNFKGDLKTKGWLTIGEHAEVNADIQGEIIVIAGKVKGNIFAEKKISLFPTAVVEGELKTSLLEVQEGAIFEGYCRMIGEKMNVKDVSRYLDIEENKILEWADEGKIPAIKEGNHWVFERKRLDVWIKETR